MSRRPISDLDLFSNLKRRTVSDRPGWSLEQFEGSVGSKLDKPQAAVQVSRSPALVGLAAVIGVMLVLLVVLPNVRPSPGATPAPSPRAAGASMSPAEFQMRFVADELNGQTVLVNGRIEQFDTGGMLYGTHCTDGDGVNRNDPPIADCVMGRLSGTEPALWPNARYLAVGVNEWRAAVPPAEGALVLNVTENGFIEYVGTVAVTAGEPSSVRAVSALHLESLDLDDVVLVDASLTGVATRECPATPFRIAGLPWRGCEPSTLSDASGAMGVQDNAYFEFAPNADPQPATGPVTPRRAIYAIAKRLEGCGNTPCWQWEVVGRLSGDLEETQTAPATPQPSTPQIREIACEAGGEYVHIGAPTVSDELDLVVSCSVQRDAVDPGDSVEISNPGGDVRRLKVEWRGTPCDIASRWVVFEGPEGYVLNGARPSVDCDAMAVSHAMILDLSRDVDSESVSALLTGTGLSASATPDNPLQSCWSGPPGSDPDQVRALVKIIDETGLIALCEATTSTASGATNKPFVIENPDGDEHVLRLTWEGVCNLSGRFSLRPSESGFQLVVSVPPHEIICDGFPVAHEAFIYLDEPVPVATLQTTFVEKPPAHGEPTPPPTIECSGMPPPQGVTRDPVSTPTLIDETGLVASCLQTDVVPELVGPISVSNVFDAESIQVIWQDGVCDAAAVLTLTSFPDDTYGLAVERPGTCESDGEPLPIQITFSQPVSAGSVHATLSDGPRAGICRHAVTDVVLAAPVVTDVTGLVDSCGSFDSVRHGNEALVVLENVDDPLDRSIQLLWYGGACQTDTTVSLSRSGDRFVLNLNKGGAICQETAIRRIRLRLSEPVDVSRIDLLERSSGMACPAEDTDDPPLLLADTTGLVTGCAQTPISVAHGDLLSYAAIWDGDPLHVLIRWRESSGCYGPIKLGFSDDGQDGYELLLTPSGGSLSVCVDAVGPIQRGVILHLAEAIDPGSVTVQPNGL